MNLKRITFHLLIDYYLNRLCLVNTLNTNCSAQQRLCQRYIGIRMHIGTVSSEVITLLNSETEKLWFKHVAVRVAAMN